MRFKTIRCGILLLALVVLAAGCGSKGALYLPKEQSAKSGKVEPTTVDATNPKQDAEEDEEGK